MKAAPRGVAFLFVQKSMYLNNILFFRLFGQCTFVSSD